MMYGEEEIAEGGERIPFGTNTIWPLRRSSFMFQQISLVSSPLLHLRFHFIPSPPALPLVVVYTLIALNHNGGARWAIPPSTRRNAATVRC